LRKPGRARQLVTTDTEITGGKPVFRETRIQVHLIAALLEQGEAADNVLADYPRLTQEMIQLAPIYAAAYPRRGRPRAQPWHHQQPLQRSRRKLAMITVA
jgi:uncharacterized protein (DUF433 family)